MSSYTDSDAAEVTLSLTGVWIHDPLDPETTAVNYPYGRSSRTASVDVERTGLSYAGRTYPVFEYGEHQDDVLNVRVDVPNGPTYATELATLVAYAQLRRTVCVRDNRGRRVFGSLSDYDERDQDWGTEASIRVRRSEFDESVT